jgi:hypothetical protein
MFISFLFMNVVLEGFLSSTLNARWGFFFQCWLLLVVLVHFWLMLSTWTPCVPLLFLSVFLVEFTIHNFSYNCLFAFFLLHALNNLVFSKNLWGHTLYNCYCQQILMLLIVEFSFFRNQLLLVVGVIHSKSLLLFAFNCYYCSLSTLLLLTHTTSKENFILAFIF